MQEFCIHFQHNRHPRDLVYELSTTYLIARAIHMAAKLRLADKLNASGTSRETITSNYSNYDANAISLLIDYLIAYSIIELKKDGLLYSTPLSRSLSEVSDTIALSIDEWIESYDILTYLNKHIVATQNVEIRIHESSLSLRSASSKALIFEFAQLHLLSRAIRYATTEGIFEIVASNTQAIKLQDQFRQYLPVIKLLSRYQLLFYDETQNTLQMNASSHFLKKDNQESLHPAMLIIDARWWKAVGYIEESFKKNCVSSFEFANSVPFYEAYADDNQSFAHGMAAISLHEDAEVAYASVKCLQPYKNIIDIGGGEGGLLTQLHHTLGDSKTFTLFEKNNPQNAQLRAKDVKINVVLGDFLQSRESNNIPKMSNAAYIIKCVLHNMQKNDVITLLRNIRLAMQDECQLFIAERVIDGNGLRPQANLASNLLMRILFRAEAHTLSFYTEVIEVAGFTSDSIINAGNYRVFAATEKPELRFQKTQHVSNFNPITLPMTQSPAPANPQAHRP